MSKQVLATIPLTPGTHTLVPPAHLAFDVTDSIETVKFGVVATAGGQPITCKINTQDEGRTAVATITTEQGNITVVTVDKETISAKVETLRPEGLEIGVVFDLFNPNRRG